MIRGVNTRGCYFYEENLGKFVTFPLTPKDLSLSN